MSSSASRDLTNSVLQHAPPVLNSGHNLVGMLESVEPVGDGLVKVKIAGLERCVAEEIEIELKPLVGKKASILRVGDDWSAVEWPGWRS